MSNTILFNENYKEIGLRVRNKVEGPESALVSEFVEKKISASNKCKNIAVFIEPEISTGYPDVVFVNYDATKMEYWNKKRNQLKEAEIKILYFLMKGQKKQTEEICHKLGMSKSNVYDSLMMLWDSCLVMREYGQWRVPYDIKNQLLITQITAVEAKINDWKTVFEQAQMNSSFSHMSYVLTPTKEPSRKTLDYAQKIGVGIYGYSNNKISRIVSSSKRQGVIGYNTLVFNEWLGKYLYSSL